MSARITQLRNTVQTIHGCKAEHVKSVPVIEMFWGKVAWDGVVEVFRLTGHPKSKTVLRVELYGMQRNTVCDCVGNTTSRVRSDCGPRRYR